MADAETRRAELVKGKELLERLVDWWLELLPSDVSVAWMGEDACSARSGGSAGLLATITGRPYASGVEIG